MIVVYSSATDSAAPKTRVDDSLPLSTTSICRSIRRFLAQLRFIKHLDDDAVGIGAVEGGAAIAMNFKWVNYGSAGGAELFFKLFNPLDALDDEAEMVQVLLRCYSRKAGGYLVQSNIVAAGREIDIFWVGFPNHIHAKHVLIKALCRGYISDFERYVAHPFDTGEGTHGSTI